MGRTFEEAYQKALRMLDIGVQGAIAGQRLKGLDLRTELREPTPHRAFALTEAFLSGMSVEEVHELTSIDPWFLKRIQDLAETAAELRSVRGGELTDLVLAKVKRAGFSDRQIAEFTGHAEEVIYERRQRAGIVPRVKQIDTLAAEYPARTNYLYLTYHAGDDEVTFGEPRPVMVLGTGAYRIGSSVEFDWCCVGAVRTLRQHHYQTLMLNCNPETVSTDYDECDRLYFEEITFETVREIHKKEAPFGLVVSMGGQTPNNLALRCHEAGMRILGTPAISIDMAENRKKFSLLCDELGVAQPAWAEVATQAEAEAFAESVGYPVLVRPSYVLSGAAMAVVENPTAMRVVLARAAEVSPGHPTVVSRFVNGAKETRVRRGGEGGRDPGLCHLGARGKRGRAFGRCHLGASRPAHLP